MKVQLCDLHVHSGEFDPAVYAAGKQVEEELGSCGTRVLDKIKLASLFRKCVCQYPPNCRQYGFIT